MQGYVAPAEPIPCQAPHPVAGRVCAFCGSQVDTAASSGGALCGPCRGRLLTEVSRRSAQVRAAIEAMKAAPSSCDADYVSARQHLIALANYERQGFLRLTPSPTTLLERLEALRAERRAQIAAAQATRGVRERAPVDWVGEVAAASTKGRLGRANRRAEPRHRASLNVLVQPLGITVPARDVSLGGIYLVSTSHRAAGSLLRLTIHTAEGPVVMQGIVRRIDRSGTGLSTRVTGFAVQFTKAPPALLARLLPQPSRG